MKSFIKSLTIGAACILMLNCPVFPASAEQENFLNNCNEIEVSEEVLLQQNALNAYNTLYSTFEIDENYNYILPDDYAGEYINDYNNLVLQLTTTDYSYYEEILSNYDCVEFNTVEYSYNELYQLADKTRCSILEDMNDIVYMSSKVDVKDNIAKVEIGVLPSVKKTIYKSNRNSTLPIDVEYVYVDPAESKHYFLSGANFDNTLSNSSYDLIGGDMVKSYLSTATLGYCGSHNGKKAIITAGHAFSLNTTVGNNSGNFGVVNYSRYEDDNYGDFCIIDLFDYSKCELTNKVKYKINTVNITATAYSVPAGTICHKYGEQSTYSTISTLGTEDVTYKKDGKPITIKGLVSAHLESGHSQDGDSGGPIYVYENGKWTFCGIHSGYEARSKTVYFTPYLYIYGIFTAKTS